MIHPKGFTDILDYQGDEMTDHPDFEPLNGPLDPNLPIVDLDFVSYEAETKAIEKQLNEIKIRRQTPISSRRLRHG